MEIIKKHLGKILTIATIVAGSEACVPKSKADNPAQAIQQTTEDIGKQACKILEPGKHKIEDAQLECFDDSSFYVEKDGVRKYYNMPETQELNEQGLERYIQGKRVILFGENHNENATHDGDVFLRMTPSLLKAGFTYIGIEYDHVYHQSIIDQYYLDNDETKISQEFSKETINIIKTAKRQGMKIFCVDIRSKDLYQGISNKEFWEHRDQLMFENLEKFLDGNSARMAVFIGAGHATSEGNSIAQQGSSENGMPNLVKIHKPLGYRLVKKYGKEKIGLVDLTGCSDTSPFTYACVKENSSKN